MKTSLEHLPKEKREELKIIVGMIREAFEVEMIILFGSYARGDWVEEMGTDGFYYKYQSDFDILVIAEGKLANQHRKWAKVEDRILRSTAVSTPVTLIHHGIGFLNDRLSKGHYFFSDIKREGILLYDSKRFELAEARELSAEEYRKKVSKYFDHWFTSANDFFEQFQFALTRDKYNNAAFQLHQTVERYYSALLLVLIDYKPKTHDIEKLGKLAAAQEPVLLIVFPKGTEEERYRFELLRKAYVDARYEETYMITRQELKWLAERVKMLQELTEKVCKRKIESFTKNAVL